MGELLSGIRPLTYHEVVACKQELADVMGVQPGEVIPEKVTEGVKAVFAAFYRGRFGPAVGSTAVNLKTGQTAIRYYDAEFNTFRWLVSESPERAELHAERMDALPAGGKEWTVTERSWKDLVFA